MFLGTLSMSFSFGCLGKTISTVIFCNPQSFFLHQISVIRASNKLLCFFCLKVMVTIFEFLGNIVVQMVFPSSTCQIINTGKPISWNFVKLSNCQYYIVWFKNSCRPFFTTVRVSVRNSDESLIEYLEDPALYLCLYKDLCNFGVQ